MLPISFFYHLCLYVYILSFICTIRCYCNDYAIVKFLSVRLSLFVCCGVEFGYWVCGESWLAIKDTLTHRPSSQGWAPSVLLSCQCVYVFCMDVLGFVNVVVVSLSL